MGKPTPQAEEVHPWLPLEGIVGESKPFLQVVAHTMRVAPSDATILLTGETGTGKELVARAVHYGSPRRDKPFVPVNCGALPDHLVENELFGHTKGAYTDASTSEKGLVAEAEEGTLFLDEVDTLSASAQVKLLRFLQDRAYRPMGSARSLTANVRIIVTLPQIRQGIAMILREAFQCGTMAHMLQECQKRLHRNELARFYHWKQRKLLAPLNVYKRQF